MAFLTAVLLIVHALFTGAVDTERERPLSHAESRLQRIEDAFFIRPFQINRQTIHHYRYIGNFRG